MLGSFESFTMSLYPIPLSMSASTPPKLLPAADSYFKKALFPSRPPKNKVV
ncbi:unnamed protein product [Haemonchus placei]|uniref:Ovule protein n=1 Tax=Haemonchus placei TaxID=6290 RepID=A0A0N4VZA7_HAEPC|nr:unnamed protein product [Haemonchus placei]